MRQRYYPLPAFPPHQTLLLRGGGVRAAQGGPTAHTCVAQWDKWDGGGRGAGEEGGVGVEDGNAGEGARGQGWEGELTDTGGGGRGAAHRLPPRGRRRSALRVPALTHAGAVDAPRSDTTCRGGEGRGGGADRGGRKNQARRARGGEGWWAGGCGGGELRRTQGPPLPQRGGRPQAARPARRDGDRLGRVRWGGASWGRRPEPAAPSGPPPAAQLSQPTHEPHARKEGRHTTLPAKAGLGGGGGNRAGATASAATRSSAGPREGAPPDVFFSKADRVSRLCVLAGEKAGARC